MSRCFPYPPPGYTLSGARNEALIESIKLQKKKEKDRKEKKEKRKEKKEKRKKRKEQRQDKKDKANQSAHESSVQKHLFSDDKFGVQKHDISQKSSSDEQIVSLQKKSEAENDQLEQSSLTEEHAHPSTFSVPSCSSESTENSKKRKRQTPPEDDTCAHGKVLSTRLPSNKQNELDALIKEGQQPCSTSGRIQSPVITGDAKDWSENFPNGTRSDSHVPNTKNNGAILCSTSLQVDTVKIENKAMPEPFFSSVQKTNLDYQSLFENLLLPQVQETLLCSEDLDWLLKCNSQGDQEKRAAKKPRSVNDGLSCSRSSGFWPRADYLLEADVYALPFTVPY